ncbi:Methyltransferase [Giardia duodenalis]|uniref:DNA methyltransferase n=2 Tax=Giardia intestinalis TaxID=5741 RepID=C6LT10_GIAIB|nr:DNA methyltransferase [Giardia intestinalis ATCC 50581]ESU42521.1 Methyltransferase [Giardia intestinalis]
MMPAYKATLDDCKHVYLPDEDTFLLIDTLTKLSKELQPQSFVEIGSGSGVVSVHIFQVFPKILEGHAIDISPYAVDMTRRTAALNNVPLLVHEGSFFEPLDTRTDYPETARFDLIVFNPPYVPSLETDPDLGPLDLALAGGKNGSEIILQFLETLPSHLAVDGCCIMVAIEANDIKALEHNGRSKGLKMVILAEKRLRSEHLYILHFSWDKDILHSKNYLNPSKNCDD